MNEKQDKTRQLVDLAISAGRIRQSPQTGYVHHCYQAVDEGLSDTIPLYENCLFALALLKVRSSDSITEAKDLLNKLLFFQNREDGEFHGNFPIYIHEYPQCKDRFLGTLLLPAFYWILKNFGVVLGNELKQKITQATQDVLNHCWRTHQVKEAPFQIAIKIASAHKGFGELWKDLELIKKGEDLLEQLLTQSQAADFGSWYSPAYMGDTFVALQMAYPIIGKSPWKYFLSLMSERWYQKGYSPVGPAIKVFQWSEEPQTSLLDFIQGIFLGSYSYRAFNNQVLHLQGILIQSPEDVLPQITLPFSLDGKVSDYQWDIYQTENYAYSALQKPVIPNPSLEKSYHSFYLTWGSRIRTFTFVCQGGNSTFVDYRKVEGGLDFIFYLSEPIEADDREQSREISFYCDKHEDLSIKVDNQSASVFQLGNEVIVEDNFMAISLTFLHEEGDGRFLGHVTPVNRPSQLNVKGSNRFTVYDWQISLRTIRRYTPCRVMVKVRINPKPQEEI